VAHPATKVGGVSFKPSPSAPEFLSSSSLKLLSSSAHWIFLARSLLLLLMLSAERLRGSAPRFLGTKLNLWSFSALQLPPGPGLSDLRLFVCCVSLMYSSWAFQCPGGAARPRSSLRCQFVVRVSLSLSGFLCPPLPNASVPSVAPRHLFGRLDALCIKCCVHHC